MCSRGNPRNRTSRKAEKEEAKERAECSKGGSSSQTERSAATRCIAAAVGCSGQCIAAADRGVAGVL
ncbi:hypothetical protein LSTR_LSTR016754 [Laodelphax striatellus]|uniref:Uncharacterized protein n=1 Tax=Laodelphax striatellus TaxID=195883 RepID=A0A482WRG7_LAOST|nr:hypothetical protein LSTR_LSTR016754 [Laodelphax striatellus]